MLKKPRMMMIRKDRSRIDDMLRYGEREKPRKVKSDEAR
jgi:hypothetical protein